MSLPQGALLNNALPPPPPPPQPLGCCPKCGFSGEPSCFLRTSGQASLNESLRYVSVAEKQPPSGKELQEFRGGQRGSSKFSRRSAPSDRTQVFYRRRSFRDKMQGRSRPSKMVEALVYSTPDAMLMLTTSSLCPKGVSSFDPAVFEASISSQVSGNLLSSRVRDEGVSGVGNTESSVLDLQPPPASYNYCNVLTSKSSLNLPKERLCSLQGVVLLLQCSQGAISQYVKLVIGIWTVMMVLLVSNLREPIVKLLLWMSLPMSLPTILHLLPRCGI